MKKLLLLTIITSLGLLSSCNKDNLDAVLFGTWSVTKVEGLLIVNGSSTITLTDNSPTGTVEFNKNGTGEQNYAFSIAGTANLQTGSFTWEATDEEIIIVRTGEPDLIWRRVLDTENKQMATYNIVVDASQSWDYTLTLEK